MLNASSDSATPVPSPKRPTVPFNIRLPEPSPEAKPPPVLLNFVEGWPGVAATVITSLPWLIIGVFDAIDSSYRTVDMLTFRLIFASICLLVAYGVGLVFVGALIYYTRHDRIEGRHDEIATVLVLLVFNIWHVSRNVRGWLQFFAIRKVRPLFAVIQRHFGTSFQHHSPSELLLLDVSLPPYYVPGEQRELRPCIQDLLRLRISNRLIDNDWHARAPFLNPLFHLRPPLHPELPTTEENNWAVAMWRAWWTQDTALANSEPLDICAPETFLCDAVHRYPDVEDLLETDPSGLESPLDNTPRPVVTHQVTGEVITNKREWADALLTYGTPEGQQDTHGERLPPIANMTDASGIAVLVHEKTTQVANRMSALWYNTARFEEVYDEKAFDATMRHTFPKIMFPKWPSWLNIAHDIAAHATNPLTVSDRMLVVFAGEMASASLILVRYPEKFRTLVRQVYQDGLNARWTFGWSGLLACFSHLWTEDRIYIALLNGLSLLALASTRKVSDIDANVRAMLYGYAAFAVSDRAVGKRIAQDRKAELLTRYSQNKGKTCRGSGLCATRLACRALQLPAEASHMDGLPAFSTGWASEFLDRKPGNQVPEHGKNHDEVEALQGSSNMWRYPHSHT